LVELARPGHGIPSQDRDPAAQILMEPQEAQREARSTLMGGGMVAGMGTGAAIGVAVAGPVGVLVGASLGAAAGALGGAAAGTAANPTVDPGRAGPLICNDCSRTGPQTNLNVSRHVHLTRCP
jgi:hypothetical protein